MIGLDLLGDEGLDDVVGDVVEALVEEEPLLFVLAVQLRVLGLEPGRRFGRLGLGRFRGREPGAAGVALGLQRHDPRLRLGQSLLLNRTRKKRKTKKKQSIFQSTNPTPLNEQQRALPCCSFISFLGNLRVDS